MGLIATDAGDVGGVVHGDGLGVLVLGVVLLCVDLFVLFEVLGALEGLVADLGRGERGRDGRSRQTSQIWGLRGVCTGGRSGGARESGGDGPLRWEVMWSRLAQEVEQSFQLQVRQRLFVDLRPMWSLQRWT